MTQSKDAVSQKLGKQTLSQYQSNYVVTVEGLGQTHALLRVALQNLKRSSQAEGCCVRGDTCACQILNPKGRWTMSC